jgi:hypothetical protein
VLRGYSSGAEGIEGRVVVSGTLLMHAAPRRYTGSLE